MTDVWRTEITGVPPNISHYCGISCPNWKKDSQTDCIRCCCIRSWLLCSSACMHLLLPTSLNLWMPESWINGFGTDTSFLRQPVARKHVGEQAVGTAAPLLWNNLPTHLRSTITLPAFKTALKTYFFKQYFEGQWSGSIGLCWTVLCINVFYCTAQWSTWWEAVLPNRLLLLVVVVVVVVVVVSLLMKGQSAQ